MRTNGLLTLFLVFIATSSYSQIESNKILFIVGADGTVGFLSGSTDHTHKASINESMNGKGWKQLADTLEASGYELTEIAEGAGGTPVPFDNLDIAQYALIVFGSNNAIYQPAQLDSVDQYIRNGGSALFISDANFGEDWADASNSDQQFLDNYGWTMNQDNGTYSIDQAEFIQVGHPILDQVSQFDGEGVTPITLNDSTISGICSKIITDVPNGQSVRRNNGSGGNNQGSTSAAMATDATLIVATVENGRIAGHFDRNTFFNQRGPGTDITRFSNKRYAINLFDWLAQKTSSNFLQIQASEIVINQCCQEDVLHLEGNFSQFEMHLLKLNRDIVMQITSTGFCQLVDFSTLPTESYLLDIESTSNSELQIELLMER